MEHIRVVVNRGESDIVARASDRDAESPATRAGIDLKLCDESTLRRKLDELVRSASGIHRIAVGRDQMTIGGEDQPQGAMQVYFVPIDELALAVVVVGFASAWNGENRIVAGGGHIEHIPLAIVSESRWTDYQRGGIGTMLVTGGNLRCAGHFERVLLVFHRYIQPCDGAAQNIGDAYLGSRSFVVDG